MKPLTGSVLLILLLGVTGCGAQNPGGAGANPTQTTRIPEGLDERHAANFLAGAKHLQKIGEPKQAVETLNELIANYPGSDAADEARQILADLEEQEPDVKAAGVHVSGEIVTARGVLIHFPQNVKSTEAWSGNEFMVGETPIRTTEEVPREVLMKIVGQHVEIEGRWKAGKKWEPPKPADEEFQLQTPSFPEGVTGSTGAGIEATSVKVIEK